MSSFIPCTFSKCLSRLLFRLKLWLHKEHENGLSPVCVRMCLFISDFVFIVLGHIGHANWFTSSFIPEKEVVSWWPLSMSTTVCNEHMDFFICCVDFTNFFILFLQSNNIWLYIYQMMLILIMFWQNIFTAKSCMAHGAGKRFFSSMNSNVSFCISQTLYLQKAKWTLIFLTSQIYWIISSFLHLLQAKNKKKLKKVTRIFCKQTAFR